jgi:hypothetical protein
MTKSSVNLAITARARLTQRARERRENAQLVMTRYAIESLLYRLSLSPFREAFVLKGAMLFSLWAPTPYRATGDLDLLGFGDNTPAGVAEIFRQVLEVPSEDGVIFKPETLRAAAARAEDEYSGVSLDVQAELAGARLPIHVDIGYGDAITPGVLDIDYPSLLDMPMPRLKAYPPETVLAEKFQAMTALGIANSRMKDFFDIWASPTPSPSKARCWPRPSPRPSRGAKPNRPPGRRWRSRPPLPTPNRLNGLRSCAGRTSPWRLSRFLTSRRRSPR